MNVNDADELDYLDDLEYIEDDDEGSYDENDIEMNQYLTRPGNEYKSARFDAFEAAVRGTAQESSEDADDLPPPPAPLPMAARSPSTTLEKSASVKKPKPIVDKGLGMCEECDSRPANAVVRKRGSGGGETKLCKRCARARLKANHRSLRAAGTLSPEEEDFDAFLQRTRTGDGRHDNWKPDKCSWTLAGWCVRCPCVVMLVMLIPLILTIISATEPFEIDTGGDGLQVRSDRVALQRDAVKVLLQETYFSVPPDQMLAAAEAERQTQSSYVLALTYEVANDGNVFRADRLLYLRDLHQRIAALDGYEDFCLRRKNLTGHYECSAPFSLVNYFFPTKPCLNATIRALVGDDFVLNDGRGDLVESPETTLERLYSDPQTRSFVDSFVSKGFTDYNYRSVVTKAIFSFGLPLRGYKNKDDRPDEQQAKFDEWILDAPLTILNDATDLAEDDETIPKVFYIGTGVTDAQVNDVILGDGALAFAAILFVGLYTWFHTGSSFLASLGMLHVLMSLPVAYFIFRFIIGAEKFGMLNTLSIFVILGIGADDIFLMVDAFKQSKLAGTAVSQSLRHRLAWTWARASKAMLITSLTTSFAFFANAQSIIQPIRVFGVFTGFLVIVNFLLVISWFPAVLVLWSRWFEDKAMVCTKCLPRSSDKDVEQGEPGESSIFGRLGVHQMSEAEANKRSAIAQRRGKTNRKFIDVTGYRPVERFFYSYYAPFMQDHKGKILGFFFIAIIVAIYGALQLEAASEPARFLPDEFPVQRAIDLESNVFKESDFVTTVFLTYGVKPINRDGTDPNDASDIGTLEYDTSFDPTSESAQRHIWETCQLAKLELTTRRDEVFCPLSGLTAFYKALKANNGTFMMPGDASQCAMFPTIDQTKCENCVAMFGADANRVAQCLFAPSPTSSTMMSVNSTTTTGNNTTTSTMMMSTSSSTTPSPSSAMITAECENDGVAEEEEEEEEEVFEPIPSDEFIDVLREYTKNYQLITGAAGVSLGGENQLTNNAGNMVRWRSDTQELVAMIIMVNTTLPRFVPEASARPLYDAWEDFVAERIESGPDSLKSLMQVTSSGLWVQMETEAVLAESALFGTLISLVLAFVVMLLSTMNILIAIYAILAVVFIVVSFIAITVAIGWTLGIIESICITIIVGLSVDFVLHLAHSYVETSEGTRYERVSMAILDVGISVFSAAITTLGAGLLLLFTTVLFFVKFGLFVFLTIATSFVFAFGFFVAVLLVAGPVGDQGSLTALVRRCYKDDDDDDVY